MANKYTRALKRLALDGALSPEAAEKLIKASATDGGPGSGNFGHLGRHGKVGGSSSAAGGYVSGNLGKSVSGQVFNGTEYTLGRRGLKTPNLKKGDGGKRWSSVGKKSKIFPKGSGATRITEADVRKGSHTINKYLTEDGNLTPERAELHEKIIQNLFKDKKPVPPGQQKTFYFLGGGSASGKGSFTKKGKCEKYGVPNKDECAVIDPDVMKESIPEYQYDVKTNTGTGTTSRDKAASFAHEESSALAKRAMEAAFANGYNCTLDGTGDGSEAGVLKKINQARKAGYRVEGRYCTREIEDAIRSNLERAKKDPGGRLVQIDAVVSIHKKVSEILPKVAKEFDHCELWDHNGDTPVKIAECDRGGELKPVKGQEEAYDKFLKKALFELPKT